MARRTIELVTARAVAAEVMRRLRISPGGKKPAAFVVGSVRRGAPAPHDVDLLVVADLRRAGFAPARPTDRIVSFTARAAGSRRRELVVGWKVKNIGVKQIRVDLFGAKPAELPWAMFALSSARAYQVRVRAVAARRGLRLNQYGLFDRRTGRMVPGAAKVKTERGVAAAVGVRWRPAAARV